MASKITAQLLQQHLDNIITFISPYLALANTAMINYIIDDLWVKNIPKDIRGEIKCTADIAEAFTLYWSMKYISSTPINLVKFSNYCQYLNDTHSNSLNALPHLWISPDFLKSSLLNDIGENLLNVKGFMSEKKAHEVEITSDVIATICDSYKKHGKEPIVVDAGDGKGYLSSHLALKYKIKALGVDAQSIHTNSAINRLGKLEKQWNSLEQQQKNEQAGVIVKKIGRRKRQKIVEGAESIAKPSQESKLKNYKAITHYITADTDFIKLLNDNFPIANSNPSDMVICLSGLHTCGNLAPSCLRIFQHCKQIQAICNIGCCYNKLDEQFAHPSDDNLPDKRFRVFDGKIIQIEPNLRDECKISGFPMSKHLRDKEYALGRNARMLAVQPFHRIVDEMEQPHDHLFYRALLEVLIVKNHPQYKNAIHVGRIKKCHTFIEYVRKCSKRIELLNFDHLTDGEINDMYNAHVHHYDYLKLFYMMRLSLAPIIETIILLDRFLYLKEQNDNELSTIYLVKFFDSVLSPRCYGIVGIK